MYKILYTRHNCADFTATLSYSRDTFIRRKNFELTPYSNGKSRKIIVNEAASQTSVVRLNVVGWYDDTRNYSSSKQRWAFARLLAEAQHQAASFQESHSCTLTYCARYGIGVTLGYKLCSSCSVTLPRYTNH